MNAAHERFHVGDRVRVRDRVNGGNPRTPQYVRNRTGTVLHRHGVIDNPLDHHDSYPPLYSVVFPVADGEGPCDEVVADIHEEWLAPEFQPESS